MVAVTDNNYHPGRLNESQGNFSARPFNCVIVEKRKEKICDGKHHLVIR